MIYNWIYIKSCILRTLINIMMDQQNLLLLLLLFTSKNYDTHMILIWVKYENINIIYHFHWKKNPIKLINSYSLKY